MPYGRVSNTYVNSKIIIEQILEDAAKASPEVSVVLLRYFNPIGAHHAGRLGEDIRGFPNNLMPHVTQVAVGRREKITILGNDYPTPHGTCLRDYIHVCVLADGLLLLNMSYNKKALRLLILARALRIVYWNCWMPSNGLTVFQ